MSKNETQKKYIYKIVENNKKYKLVVIIIFLFFSFIIIFKSGEYLIQNIIKSFLFLSFWKDNNFQNLKFSNKENRDKILAKGIKFINKCLYSVNTNFYEQNKNPIITAIIPLYNCDKTISSSLRSIQNQNNTNIEIILIDDLSTDNSKGIIKQIQINDKRIKLIENKRNMGTLYSRSVGALLSKGNYILCLDNDDLFFDEDVFDYVYKQSIKDDLDIVQFRALFTIGSLINIKNVKDYEFYGFKENLYLYQPKLGIWTITLNGKFRIHNNLIWSKSIKSNIYKKAINLLGIQKYSEYVCWAEDTSISFIIFNIAKSFKYIYKYGYIQRKRKSSASFTQNINNKLFGEIFFLDVMLNFSKNNSDKNYAVNMALRIKKIYKVNKYEQNKRYNYLKTLLNKTQYFLIIFKKLSYIFFVLYINNS